MLAETGLAKGSLALEITESMFMENIEAINQRLKQLNALAVQISIDDFGTGFSSLSYLHLLAVNNLKIDRNCSGVDEEVRVSSVALQVS